LLANSAAGAKPAARTMQGKHLMKIIRALIRPFTTWLFSGFTCLILALVLLFGGLLIAGHTLNGIINGIQGLLNPELNVQGVFIPTVEKITQLARLTSVRFNYANMITIKTEMPALLQGLYGENQVLVAVGHVESGIDLSKLQPSALVYDETTNTLTITLPPPELFECFLSEKDTYVAQRNSGIFAAASPQLDVASRRFAIQQFKLKAQEDGILAEAQAQAETTLREFITLFNDSASAPTIVFVATPPDPNAPLPATCQ
jgi:hypothetical protein